MKNVGAPTFQVLLEGLGNGGGYTPLFLRKCCNHWGCGRNERKGDNILDTQSLTCQNICNYGFTDSVISPAFPTFTLHPRIANYSEHRIGKNWFIQFVGRGTNQASIQDDQSARASIRIGGTCWVWFYIYANRRVDSRDRMLGSYRVHTFCESGGMGWIQSGTDISRIPEILSGACRSYCHGFPYCDYELKKT